MRVFPVHFIGTWVTPTVPDGTVDKPTRLTDVVQAFVIVANETHHREPGRPASYRTLSPDGVSNFGVQASPGEPEPSTIPGLPCHHATLSRTHPPPGAQPQVLPCTPLRPGQTAGARGTTVLLAVDSSTASQCLARCPNIGSRGAATLAPSITVLAVPARS